VKGLFPPSYLEEGDSVNTYGCFSWKKSRLGKNIPVYCIGYYNFMVDSCFYLKLFKSVVKTEFVLFLVSHLVILLIVMYVVCITKFIY